jgi:serine/threonine protein kinase
MKHELRPGDPELIGPYRLRGRLGAGGMGRVYLGLSPGGRAAAIKVIRAELAQDPEFRARFRREVAVARQVSGLYTAPVLDADADAPEPWLATAYVPGPSLADAVTQHGPLPASSVLMLAAGLAEALSAIHSAGVVHRDLKPANVLLADDGPRVIDFGISRGAEASSLTHTGLVVGSPGFMSPEQAEGREVGPSSDVFSLGAVLAFAATGRGPFGSGSTPALVYRVVHDLPQLDLVPAQIRPLIERCLAKDPAGRPTAADLLGGAALGVPGRDWLPEPVTRTFRRDQAPLAVTATDLAVADPGGAGRPPRRVRGRAFAVAAVLAALVGGGSGAAFALTGAPAHGAPSARQVAGAATATAPPSSIPSAAAASSSPASSSSAAGSPPAAAAPSYAAPTYAAPSYAPSSTAPASPSAPAVSAPPGSSSPSPPPASAPANPVTPPRPSGSSPGAASPPTSFPDVSSPTGGGTY